MTDSFDVAIVGAGPAGMAAARTVQAAGASAAVLDDQPTPGGQVWRSVEAVAARGDLDLFGSDFAKGAHAALAFRTSGAEHRPMTRVIGLERDGEGIDLLTACDGTAGRTRARTAIIAVGAYERPTPFPGWTLPGVMTMGAAQIALKSSDMAPREPFVLAGQGPLLLLFAWQLKRAGITPAAILRLDAPGAIARGYRHLPRAVGAGFGDLMKGLAWTSSLSGAIRHVRKIKAVGDGVLERVEWAAADGRIGETPARTLLVHDGVVPRTQFTRSLRAPHLYDPSAAAWRPDADPITGALAGQDNVFIAGDCAGVNGWKAAEAMGVTAAAAALISAGRSADGAVSAAALKKARATRPLLDALYPPAEAFKSLADATLVCRCEEVTAGEIRAAARLGAQGPNQLKAFTRAGMGPCQGRMCAQTTTAILAEAQGRSIEDVGLQRVRAPIFPITLGEMADLNETEMNLPRS